MPNKRTAAKPKAVSPARHATLREESLRSMLELEESVARTRNQLKVVETTVRRSRRLLEGGRSMHEIALTINAADARSVTSGLIREVQGARHRSHQAAFKLAAAEGSTMAEIAREWGVSRQLVSRMVKEPLARRKKA